MTTVDVGNIVKENTRQQYINATRDYVRASKIYHTRLLGVLNSPRSDAIDSLTPHAVVPLDAKRYLMSMWGVFPAHPDCQTAEDLFSLYFDYGWRGESVTPSLTSVDLHTLKKIGDRVDPVVVQTDYVYKKVLKPVLVITHDGVKISTPVGMHVKLLWDLGGYPDISEELKLYLESL